MNKDLYDVWKSLKGKEAIDQYFANFEIDPYWLMPDGNPTEEQIRMYDDYDEARRQAAVVTELERRIMNNLDNVTDILTEVILDPAFERTGMAMLKELNICRKKMEDILAQKKEEIMILTYGFVPWIE